jgi:hypothetical protein
MLGCGAGTVRLCLFGYHLRGRQRRAVFQLLPFLGWARAKRVQGSGVGPMQASRLAGWLFQRLQLQFWNPEWLFGDGMIRLRCAFRDARCGAKGNGPTSPPTVCFAPSSSPGDLVLATSLTGLPSPFVHRQLHRDCKAAAARSFASGPRHKVAMFTTQTAARLLLFSPPLAPPPTS